MTYLQSDANIGGKNNDDAMDEFGDVKFNHLIAVEKNKNIIDIQNIKSGWEINIDRFKPFFMGGCTINELKRNMKRSLILLGYSFSIKNLLS